MDTLKSTLERMIETYVGKGLNGYSYLMSDPDRAIFTIISVGYIKGQRLVDANLITRLVDDKIIIERDMNDKPLVDALLQAGVPRSQMILAYAGEAVPEVAM
ncbi:MAG: element excision factor XisI family protein [Chloroflexota bacterium]